MLDHIQEKMRDQEIDYEELVFMDWIQNEVNLLDGNEKTKLKEDILNVEYFSNWYYGNFYTFNYLYKEEPKSKFIPSYDRQPFIYMLKKEGTIIHGFNLNYLSPIKVLKIFMNDLFNFYYQQLDETEKNNNTKILANYKNILRYDRFFASRAIYRKYNLKFINSIKIVPKRYAKIYAMLGNGLFLNAPKTLVYSKTALHMNYRRNKNRRNAK